MKPVVAVILAASVAGCLTDYGATEGIGTAAAGKTSTTVSQNELVRIAAMLKEQLVRCWAPPAGTGVPPVKIYFELNQDGSLAGDPVVLPVNSGDMQNAQFDPVARSALRAVRACTPLRLPAARYDVWKEAEVVFDPREMKSSSGEVRR